MSRTVARNPWLVMLAVAASVAVYLFVFFLPCRERIGQLRQTVADAEDYIAETTYVHPALKDTAGRLEDLRRVCQAWEDSTPSADQLAGLFGRIHLLARNARVDTGSFDPQTPTCFESVERTPVVMHCSGTYAQLTELLIEIETMAEPVWVESIDVEPSQEDGQVAELEMNLVVFADNSDISGWVDTSD